MGLLNWLAAAAILLSPWRRKIWPLAVLAILADPRYPDPWTDPELREIIEEYRRKYIEMGYPRTMVDLAIKWAVDLAEKMFEKTMPELPPEEAKRIFKSMLRKYLEWAADYLAGMAGAAAEVEARLARGRAEHVSTTLTMGPTKREALAVA